MKMTKTSAIARINLRGVLLVFPVNNHKEPRSLWSEFYPRSRMKWEWNTDGDNRVGDLWMLMKKLSDCQKVVYSKWYQGRATFFSRKVFVAMLSLLMKAAETRAGVKSGAGFKIPTERGGKLRNPVLAWGLSPAAQEILSVLEDNSPLSTKQLKKAVGMQGKVFEAQYARATKELFNRMLVVAFGEVDDGAFPSLAIGATQLLYEDLWQEAKRLSMAEAQAMLDHVLPAGSLFRKEFDRRFTCLG